MKRTSIILILTFIGLISCKQNKQEKEQTTSEKLEFLEIIKEDYVLYKPNKEAKAVLILFGGYPEVVKDIKREFKILEIARKNSIAVLLSNFNKKLWLEENEKRQLAEKLQNIIVENQLPTDNIFIGGFSSGGNVALLISDFVTKQNLDISPKGVFVVDSPVDLVALYESAKKNIECNFSEPSVQESTWLLDKLGTQFGNPNSDISKYEEHSIYTSKTNNITNLKHLKNTKIRFYTEPDKLWWKENRMVDYDQMNAYYLKRLSEVLKKSEFNKVEYIPTENKGYRANGERHPHSWGIVDVKELIKWIIE